MTENPTKAKTGESRLRDVPNKTRQSRISTPRQPWSPPTSSSTEVTTQQVAPSAAESGVSKDNATSDDTFNRFYSAFGGLVSRVSGPLAFAGIQVGIVDPARPEQNRKSSAEVKPDRDHATLDRSITAGEPDVNKLFSRAALRSVQNGSGASPGNPAESFYVVPTTGGTMSYAGILTRAEKQARRNSLEEGEDDFVDARETPASPEMRHSATGSRIWPGRRGTSDKLTTVQNSKTIEEMQMENEALRNLTDNLSTRLHMWEVNAQSSSMALQQSIRMMHHQNSGSPAPEYLQGVSANTSPVATMTAPPAVTDDARIKELEDQIRRSQQKLESASHENEKLKNILGRYRDRWEKLKEGAKTRRAEGRDSQSNQPSATSATQSEAPGSPLPGRSPALGQPASRSAGDNPT
jgi:TolA-binding protein